MGGVLRADPLCMETFTGLRMKQFERLLKEVRERGGDGPRIGRPCCLPLAGRVLVVEAFYRTNLTMRQLAPLFGVSPATVWRVIQRVGPLLAFEPISRPADATDRLWVVDGTLVPVRDRKVGASSRGFSANVQVVIADTREFSATSPVRQDEGERQTVGGHLWSVLPAAHGHLPDHRGQAVPVPHLARTQPGQDACRRRKVRSRQHAEEPE